MSTLPVCEERKTMTFFTLLARDASKCILSRVFSWEKTVKEEAREEVREEVRQEVREEVRQEDTLRCLASHTTTSWLSLFVWFVAKWHSQWINARSSLKTSMCISHDYIWSVTIVKAIIGNQRICSWWTGMRRRWVHHELNTQIQTWMSLKREEATLWQT